MLMILIMCLLVSMEQAENALSEFVTGSRHVLMVSGQDARLQKFASPVPTPPARIRSAHRASRNATNADLDIPPVSIIVGKWDKMRKSIWFLNGI